MARKTLGVCLLCVCLLVATGCAPLIIGAAVGGLGGYAISRDTIQTETDTPYERLWDAALAVGKIRGEILQEDHSAGYFSLQVGPSKVWIRLVRLTQSTTRLKVSARKYHFPNMDLAQEIFAKIFEQAK